MSPKTSRIVSPRETRPQPRRRSRRGLWLVLALLLVAFIYFVLPRPEPPPRIGIIAGHWQYDSGATCPDGLREVDITVPVARRTVELLEARGYQVELLPEYAAGLSGYRAAALVSIHADSCIPGLSGFKVAGPARLFVEEQSSLLVDCLTQAYGAASGLSFHANTITPAMTGYYAFQRIDPRTPAAIIELGFMGDDRELLTAQQDRLARGIVEGLISFLSAEMETRATTTAIR